MNKKYNYILSLLILLIGGNIEAQQKSFIDLDAGAAIPYGNYADPDPKYITYGSRVNGFAKTGFFVSAEATKYFTSHFGIAAQLTYVNNPFDKDSFEAFLVSYKVDVRP